MEASENCFGIQTHLSEKHFGNCNSMGGLVFLKQKCNIINMVQIGPPIYHWKGFETYI